MNKADQLIILKLELNIAKTKLAKFAKLSPKKMQNSVSGALPFIMHFSRHEFIESREPLQRKDLQGGQFIQRSSDGKKVSLFASGFKVYDGTLSYLEKHFNASNKVYSIGKVITRLER